MTRKNYIAIAQIVKNVMGESHLVVPLVNTLSNYFKDENEKFSPSIFKAACLNGGPKQQDDTKPLEDEKPSVKVTLPPKSTPIVTNTSKVKTIIDGAELAMQKFTERTKNVAETFRKKN